jgi:hypothetical protein
MKLRVYISPTLGGALPQNSSYIDYESPAVVWDGTRENGSLSLMCLDEEMDTGKWVLFAQHQWLALELIEPPTPEMKAKVDEASLEW